MSTKRRTQKYLSTLLPNKKSRPSMPTFAKYHPLDNALHKMISQMVQELLGIAEYSIYIKNSIEEKIAFYQSNIDGGLEQYIELNQLGEEPHVYIQLQPQPSTVPLYIQDQTNKPQDFSIKKKNRFNLHHAKQKSQSCDDSVKKKEKCLKEFLELRKCSRNDFISVKAKNRLSENEDHSEQIQQLLRRKKQLILEVKQEIKQPIRTNTQISKTYSVDKKQKKTYMHNDQGQLIQLAYKNPTKLPKEPVPLIKLSHIKVLSGQQVFLQTTMKKKPILELPITRRNKKRKDVGDTCVLIEQMFQNDNTSKLDQQQLIQQACRAKNGIRFSIKQENINSVIRLPTIR